MARIRTIKPEFFTSDDVCALSPLARLLFIGLWCEADREGRMVWSPSSFKRRYLPDDRCQIDAICQELVGRGLVVLYGEGLAFIPTFAKHQYVNPREMDSKLPEPDASSRVSDASPRVSDVPSLPSPSLPIKRGPGKKSQIPDDWKPDDALIEYAKAQGCADPVDTFERFRLHHASKGTLHQDWTKAAQLWCRNEKNFARPAGGLRQTSQTSQTSTLQHDTQDQWRGRIRGWKPGKFWHRSDWGPEPGQPGCRVPAAILSEWESSTKTMQMEAAA